MGRRVTFGASNHSFSISPTNYRVFSVTLRRKRRSGRRRNPIRAETAGRGDEMQEYFVGINYFFYGHKLKWQNAIQYTEMDNLGTEVYEVGDTLPALHQLVIQVFSCPIQNTKKKIIMGN